MPRLATALALLQRRGPDAIGQLIRWDGALALGHRLLSIMDSDRSAAQPMVDPETESAIIFNGAIYNFPELRQELTADGIRFRTSGDTEVLLAAWRKWGKGAFARLNGIWSIIIHDQREDCLIVSRDRLGVKPL
ncbi:MAG: asparagine synthase (glutamine-hydrolyzing), partial [Alphaproteobacteria bacterium]|nr:asparagine synthase (glutamine-hydrolyzing) [Alphaproteobacteria bacterium]